MSHMDKDVAKISRYGISFKRNYRYKWIIILIFKTLKFSAYVFMRIGKLSKNWKIGFIPNFLGNIFEQSSWFLNLSASYLH